MLAFARATLAFLWLMVVAIAGSIFFLFRFRNTNNLHIVGQIFHRWAMPILGIEVERRNFDRLFGDDSFVIIANHQHSLDVPLFAGMVPPRTITIGKKEVLWIPFFGLIFYASGNLTIDRKNLEQAKEVFEQAGRDLLRRGARVWLFPEGTRRYGLGLGPFKKGPFHLALATGAPLQPIIASSLAGTVNLNRRRAGRVILEVLDPIETKGRSREDLELVMAEAHEKMKSAIARLDAEVARLAKT